MPEIQVIARYTIVPGKEDELLALVQQLAQASRAEPGNHEFEIFRNADDARKLALLERYASAEALASHRETPHFQRLVPTQIVPLLESRVVETYDVPD